MHSSPPGTTTSPPHPPGSSTPEPRQWKLSKRTLRFSEVAIFCVFDITTLMTGKKKFSDIFESLPRICTFFHILCFLSYKLGGGKGGRWWLWTSDGCFGWLVHFVWSQFVSCQDILVLRATRFGYKFDPPSLSPKLRCRAPNALFFFKIQEKDYDIKIFDAFQFNIPELLCISFWFWMYLLCNILL